METSCSDCWVRSESPIMSQSDNLTRWGNRMWIALFLSTVETTIVSTSLVSITNALSGFDKRDWIVTAYLLTYTGAVELIIPISITCNKADDWKVF